MKERRLVYGYALVQAAEKPVHGWQLLSVLGDMGVEVDASVVYRTLRTMEDDGVLSSTWEHSPDGPRRRVYGITERGREALAELVEEVRGERERLDTFLEAAAT